MLMPWAPTLLQRVGAIEPKMHLSLVALTCSPVDPKSGGSVLEPWRVE